jgi:oligopeptide/dipeptide ABC transporter ATP-binding protein
MNLVEVRDLTKVFAGGRATSGGVNVTQLISGGAADGARETALQQGGQTVAVRHLNLKIAPGEIVGLVGESGSGKSTVARCLLRLIQPSSGDILFEGKSILPLRGKQEKAFRQKAQMVFQDPTATLDPHFTVERTLAEPLRVHHITSRADRPARIRELLEAVHLREDHLARYPHQLSGGMCQRAMIGMALVSRPSLLIADEPTTALDVTTEAQILDLIRDLQSQLDMAIMFITHNLGVIAQLADDVCVMYKGRVVEHASVDALFYDPKHPYTKGLLRSIPRIGRKIGRRLASIEGSVPNPFVIPAGCAFHPRCDDAIAGVCNVIMPNETAFGDDHTVECHLYGEESRT